MLGVSAGRSSQSCSMCQWLLWHGFVSSILATGMPILGPVSMTTELSHHILTDLLFLNDQSRQGAVGMHELVTCGGEGEEGAQLWVPWAQPAAPGWLAAPSSWECRTSCMAAGASSCVGDEKATCPRHWAPGIQISCQQNAKSGNTNPNLLHGWTTSPLLEVGSRHILRHRPNLDFGSKHVVCMLVTCRPVPVAIG